MRAAVVRLYFRRYMEATGVAMSDYLEMIYPQKMIGRLLKNGEVVAEYKLENCDGCEKLVKLDPFGYTTGHGGEKLIWLCGLCR